MKINIKRTIVIAICAELLLMYWTHMELRESRRHQTVYNKQPGGLQLTDNSNSEAAGNREM
ncbi:hypothetical protein [Paenibacillus hamazuiensis]|uniref:hypothetical protein n=1 Tax=Paenibacillus hamazuiensis TaxID=2936508 RepID=UPI00200F30A5|nr:hypothetical protein [Paenibacillus hamazuiensis]